MLPVIALPWWAGIAHHPTATLSLFLVCLALFGLTVAIAINGCLASRVRSPSQDGASTEGQL